MTYTVECFAPFHAAGIAEVAVNGATGIQLRYNSTAFENDELSVEGETDTVATGEVLGVLPSRVSDLGVTAHGGRWWEEFCSRGVAVLGGGVELGERVCVVGTDAVRAASARRGRWWWRRRNRLQPDGDGSVHARGGGQGAQRAAVAIPAAVVKISAEWLPDGDVLAARVGTTGPVAARWMSRQSAEVVTPARRAGASEMWLDVFDNSARARAHCSNTSRRAL